MTTGTPPELGRLEYDHGLERGARDPYGRHVLIVEPDGSAQLDHYVPGNHKQWLGIVNAAARRHLADSLAKASFPALPDQPPRIAPDSTICTLRVSGGQFEGSAWLPRPVATELDGYREAFETCDSLIRQLSDNTIELGSGTPLMVSGVELVIDRPE